MQHCSLKSVGNFKTYENLPSKGSSLAGNTLLQASVSGDHEGVVVEQLETGLVEGGSHVGLTDGQTNSVGETLTKGTLGGLRRKVAFVNIDHVVDRSLQRAETETLSALTVVTSIPVVMWDSG